METICLNESVHNVIKKYFIKMKKAIRELSNKIRGAFRVQPLEKIIICMVKNIVSLPEIK